MKPLLFIPSPRDIAEFIEATNKLKIDKIWLKYYPQPVAYKEGREFFLENEEYTHLVILPDDLIVQQKDIDMLSIDAKWYLIVSGWSNNTSGLTDDIDTDFSFTLPPMQTVHYELYNFLPISKIPDKDFILVKHQGTALTFLPRSIVQEIPFRTDFPPDLCLSYDLDKLHIPQYIDTRVRCLHMRHPHGIQVGIKEKKIIFEKM